MRIVELKAENVKHLRAVRIKPDGSMIVIGGDNAEGKSSVLDSIEMAMRGKGSCPSEPIRKGQKRAKIVLDLDDIKVTRTFGVRSGTQLVVEGKDGAIFDSPQTMLNKLTGALAFDPLEFSRMKPKEQGDVLKDLVGLDCAAWDAKYKAAFDKRTAANREAKRLEAVVESLPHDGGAMKEIDQKALVAEYREAMELNRKLEAAGKGMTSQYDIVKRIEAQIATMNESKAAAEEAAEEARIKYQDLGQPINTDAMEEKMAEATEINKRAREFVAWTRAGTEYDKAGKIVEDLTDELEAVAAAKAAAIEKAKFPIEGLGVDEDGVTFEGLPFDQASSAQQIRVSCAIGFALNPTFRVLRLKEGGLLDLKNLAMIGEMAEEADVQIWVERPSKGSECQVVMHDGEVVGQEGDE